MKYLLEVCLVALIMAGTMPPVAAQSAASVPLQKGIAVDLPVTNNAARIPDADKEDAVVVAITEDGSVHLGTRQTSLAALSDEIRNALSRRRATTLYIKADAHAPYSSVVRVLDAARITGVQRIALLTSQPGSEKPGTRVSPKGLEMQLVTIHTSAE